MRPRMQDGNMARAAWIRTGTSLAPRTAFATREEIHVTERHALIRSTAAQTAGLMLMVGLAATSAAAQSRDRTPPTTPSNLRVTSFTSYTVSLAWNPSTDNSGRFSYRVVASGTGGGTTTVSQSSTTVTLRLSAGYKYSLSVSAVDSANNRSGNSNVVTTTLPADTSPPTAPSVSAGDVTATTVPLTWTASVDDGPFVSYQVLVNGSPAVWAGGNRSITVEGLTPSTSYTLSVQGRDNWQNWSPVSNEVTVTTDAVNTSDVTAPTAPRNLTDFGMSFDDGETWLFWTQSTDNSDSQSVIRYEVFINGRLDHSIIGRDRTILYRDVPGTSTLSVVAVDVAGNRSPAATLTIP